MNKTLLFSFLACGTGVQGLTNIRRQPLQLSAFKVPARRTAAVSMSITKMEDPFSFDPFGFTENSNVAKLHDDSAFTIPLPAIAASMTALAAMPDDALAKGGEYGIFEGRISSLAHPVIMGFCFLVSLGAAYTGFQWRRIREIMVSTFYITTSFLFASTRLTMQ